MGGFNPFETSQTASLAQIDVNTKHLWNHHLAAFLINFYTPTYVRDSKMPSSWCASSCSPAKGWRFGSSPGGDFGWLFPLFFYWWPGHWCRSIYIYIYIPRYSTILRYQTTFLIGDHARFKLPGFCDNFVWLYTLVRKRYKKNVWAKLIWMNSHTYPHIMLSKAHDCG